ncbi:MAG TPA: AtpZ/AtpI family protein [Gemmatimonadaceae bacterium]
MTGGGQQPGVGGQSDQEGPGAGAYAGFGLQFAASLLVFLWVGQWIDRKLGTAPIFLMLGVFVGGGAAFYSMYRKLMAMQEREEKARKERQAGQGGGGAR